MTFNNFQHRVAPKPRLAVLATFMWVPKEEPSTGIAIATGIVSALKGQSV